MKKIKLLFYTELWSNAGIESVIMNLFRNFNLNKISVDIMAAQNISAFYDEEIKKLGGEKIISLQGTYKSPAKRMAANRKAFKDVIKQKHYDIIHLHMCNAAAMMYGKIAKDAGIKIVVYHSHNTNLSTNHRLVKTAVHYFCKWRFEKYADIMFSCSELASQWMYTRKAIRNNKVILIKNAVDLDKFEFNQKQRNEYRRRLGVSDKFVIGHIGRFALAKNHPYIIKVFAEIHKINPNSVLLLIGEGDDEMAIKEQVNQLDLNEKVIFYGTTNKVPQMLWTMDVFVLPSFFEGNPVVGIEAQAASLPCFFSDTITKMCQLTSIVTYLPIDVSPRIWAEEIIKVQNERRISTREQLEAKGYNIHSVAAFVQSLYEKALSQRND